MKTTEIYIESCDYWAKCSCGFTFRLASPNDSGDKVQLARYCGGCGKSIVWKGKHPHLPHDFILDKRRASMDWGGHLKDEEYIVPGCALCSRSESQHNQI